MGQKTKRRKELARLGFKGDVLENALRNPIAFWVRKQTKEEEKKSSEGPQKHSVYF